MIKCEICVKEFKNLHSLSLHICQKHKDIKAEDYYKKYIGYENDGKCLQCSNPTKFRGLGKGFLLFCSPECYNISELKKENSKKANIGRKQSKEVIKKRVEKINYEKIMVERKKTMLEKYGVENFAQLEDSKIKCSKIHKGTKKPRTKGHQMKIIESKRKNGTLKHTKNTGKKISNKLLKYYNENEYKYTPSDKNKNSKTGYIQDIFYRSSYEEFFIYFCLDHNIEIISAENKKYSVKYIGENGRNHRYYPDFYLKDYDLIVELKPIWRLSQDKVKILSGINYFKHYLLLTQNEIFNDNFLNIFLKLIGDLKNINKFSLSVLEGGIL
jgi:hypothetical protein